MKSERASRKKRILRGVLVLFAICLIWLIPIYWVINRQGAKAWEEAHARIVAAGFETNPEKLLTGLPSPEENAVSVPFFAGFVDIAEFPDGATRYELSDRFEEFLRLEIPHGLSNWKYCYRWRYSKKTDLRKMGESFEGEGTSAEKIERWLEKYEPEFRELDAAAWRLMPSFRSAHLSQIGRCTLCLVLLRRMRRWLIIRMK